MALNHKKLVIIPAHNEEKNIADVIQSIKKNFPADILVLNDASSDNTSTVAKATGAKVIDIPFNLGIGGVMRIGFRYALHFDYDCVVQVDADGQHPTHELARMYNSMQEFSADIIIASRFLSKQGYKSSLLRRAGIFYFSLLIFVLSGKIIRDPTSGFRMINHRVLQLFVSEYAEDYPEPESLLLALLEGFKVKEIPVEMKKRQGGKSTITPLKGCYYMLKATLSLLNLSLFK